MLRVYPWSIDFSVKRAAVRRGAADRLHGIRREEPGLFFGAREERKDA